MLGFCILSIPDHCLFSTSGGAAPGPVTLPAPVPFPGPMQGGKGFNDDMFSGGVGGALGSGGLRTELGDTRSGLPLGNGFDNRGTY